MESNLLSLLGDATDATAGSEGNDVVGCSQLAGLKLSGQSTGSALDCKITAQGIMINLGFALEGLQYPTRVLLAINWLLTLSMCDEGLMCCVAE